MPGDGGRRVLPAVMFLVSFAWTFVYVGLPFHIHDITTRDAAGTLAWTGWILGITSLVTVVSTPLWARLARDNPRAACVIVQACQGVGFFATALADSLGELFLARLGLGIVGSTSTFAFILVGRVLDPADLRRRVAAVQGAITVGNVAAPLVGAVAMARFGFAGSCMIGGTILLASGALVHWGVPPSPPAAPAATPERTPLPLRELAVAAGVVLVASIHESFLAAVLPQVLPHLGVAPARVLEAGGVLIFASGVAAAVGGLAAPRLLELMPERRLLPLLVVASSAGLLALAAPRSLGLYILVRFLQAVAIAPLFPLVVARIAQHGGGE
ncbi:MAG TPA: MFS transporter, partial [Methylomirabilota bacterium]|nr:MFS transporter [Methylomirabilota bacterium]